MKVQDLIQNSPADREEERTAEIRVIIPVYGHESTCWKAVLRFMRHARLIHGYRLKFFAGGEELEDDMSDDDGEYWHHLDWKDPKLRAQVEPVLGDDGKRQELIETPRLDGQVRGPWMGAGIEITYDTPERKGEEESLTHLQAAREALKQDLEETRKALSIRIERVDRDLRELAAGYEPTK